MLLYAYFFETFPVVLVDEEGIVRADVPFKKEQNENTRVQHKRHGLILWW